ncbi:DUF11 domain-containing protein [Candidatus Bipolaricaulota bacterium]|nr:DUF11 domain-containing protein [Candidatus Bipolaricaulota bacterium]
MLTRVLRVVVGAFVVVAVSASLAFGNGASISSIGVSPDPVSRWQSLTYEIVITNGTSAADLTVNNPLPNGLDQNNASYSVDSGDWHTLPPYGMISLGTVAAGRTLKVDIKARVQSNAPATLTDTADLTDGSKKLDSASVTVNVLPSVDAGPDMMVRLGATTTFSDAWAEDGGGSIVSYEWEARATDGTPVGTFVDPSIIHPTYSAPTVSGAVRMTLTVTDVDGGETSDAFWLNVNSFPTANAGSDKTINEGQDVKLIDASGIDSDGWIQSYEWSDGGVGGTFDDPHKLHAGYTAPSVDDCNGTNITLTLTVTDNLGAVGSDDVQIHVVNVNHLPQVNAGDDQSVELGDHVTLSGTASDVDGPLADVHWEQVAGPTVVLSDPSALGATFTAPDSEATIQLKLVATDTCGDAASDVIVISVSSTPVPPLPPPVTKTAKIKIEKVADRKEASLGETIAYTYTVTNTGQVTLSSVSVTDDKLGLINLGHNVLAPGETTSGSAHLTVTIDLFPGPVVNKATATARNQSGGEVSDSTSASVALYFKSAGIDITLIAQDSRGFPISPFDLLSVGEEITYVYTITNTGESVLDNLTLRDERIGEIPLSRTDLAPWESIAGSFTVTISEGELPGAFSDTATVTAIDPIGKSLEASDTLVLYGLSSSGDLELTKTCSTNKAAVGDVITYTYEIANVGKTTITDLLLTDDHLGDIPLPTRVIAPGERIIAYADYTVSENDLPGPLTNSASISGQGLAGEATTSSTSLSIEVMEANAGGGGSSKNLLDGRVIINEIAWAGTPASPADEWIELRNLGSIPVDLTGWTLCWYRKGGTIPPEDQWTRVPLSGTISPSPIDLSVSRVPGSQIAFVQSSADSWRVVDISWWAAGKKDNADHGYYLLERRGENTVSDVASDLVYDRSTTYQYILPDSGAVVFLLDAEGSVVDTANGEHTNIAGWPAGDVNTCATMERTDPLAGDLDNNWHTNPGILTSGHDAAGDRLIASVAKPNSPSLDELTFIAQDRITPTQADGTISVSVQGEGKPRVQVSALGIKGAAGGGASASGLSFSTHYSKKEALLTINTAPLATGRYYVWITNGAGEATLVPFAVK